MFLILRRPWEVYEVRSTTDEGKKVLLPALIPAGRHEVERIDSPFGYSKPWLVLKRNGLIRSIIVGQTEENWRIWDDPMFGDSQVTIEENDTEGLHAE